MVGGGLLKERTHRGEGVGAEMGVCAQPRRVERRPWGDQDEMVNTLGLEDSVKDPGLAAPWLNQLTPVSTLVALWSPPK